MSITADAVHFMHHGPGMIKIEGSSFQGQGDYCFNVHGNFIVIDSVDSIGDAGGNTTHSVSYIDETGPGWITAAPTWFVGDEVQFYSRTTLQPIPAQAGGTAATQHNAIVAATPTTVTFRDPIPSGVHRYDMCS